MEAVLEGTAKRMEHFNISTIIFLLFVFRWCPFFFRSLNLELFYLIPFLDASFST